VARKRDAAHVILGQTWPTLQGKIQCAASRGHFVKIVEVKTTKQAEPTYFVFLKEVAQSSK